MTSWAHSFVHLSSFTLRIHSWKYNCRVINIYNPIPFMFIEEASGEGAAWAVKVELCQPDPMHVRGLPPSELLPLLCPGVCTCPRARASLPRASASSSLPWGKLTVVGFSRRQGQLHGDPGTHQQHLPRSELSLSALRGV